MLASQLLHQYLTIKLENELIFYFLLCRCNLPSEEIRRRYSKGDHAEADETTNIMFIPVAEVLSLRTKEIWNQIAPSAKGCLLLYCS